MIPTASGGRPVGQPPTPTQQMDVYKPGNYNYSSLPPVPFDQTEFGKKFAQGQTLFGSMAGPQMEALRATGNNLNAQLGMLMPGYSQQAGLLGQETANQRQQLFMDIAGNARLGGNVKERADVNYNQYLNQYGTLAEQAAQQQRAAAHDAIARGAYGGAGTRQDFADIAANRDFALKNAGYNFQDAALRLRQQGIELENQASKFGLTGEQLNIKLQQGLTKLGIDQTMSVSQLMNMIGSNNYQQATLAQGILEKALGFTGTQ